MNFTQQGCPRDQLRKDAVYQLYYRNAWMKRQMKTPDEKGGLTCALCGRKGLNPHTKDKNKLATLDHIVELRMGGPWREPSNFQVACYTCNCRRSSTKS